jgi:L,D-peptidoglycan transpeptidase YkuD (ErfK/YbiS/YcfS/YnhG family)
MSSESNHSSARISLYQIVVGIQEQQMRVVRLSDGVICSTYTISTALNGTGCTEGSGQTPLGSFCIRECIGEGRPAGTLFQSRRPVGIWPDALPDSVNEDADMILGRILWLDGLDADNANTHSRYIYIHGTNHISLLGTPASHGCVRMHPDDIVQLFSLVTSGTSVSILDHF